MQRQIELKTGYYYHVFNKSIEKFIIFNNDNEFQRMLQTVRYYQSLQPSLPFANFLRSAQVLKTGIDNCLNLLPIHTHLVDILAFCVMPTHIHFLLKQSIGNGISTFMGNIQNSYARYFNKKHSRKGPLWVGRFKAVLVETNEELRHVSRYIHLNPTTADLVKKPELWTYSSYKEIIEGQKTETVTTGRDIIGYTSEEYKKFVERQISYQQELAIRHLMLE